MSIEERSQLDPQALFDKVTATKPEAEENPVEAKEVENPDPAPEENPEGQGEVSQPAEAEAKAEEQGGSAEPVEGETPAEPAETQIPKSQYDEIRAKQKAATQLAEERAQENAALKGRLDQLERLVKPAPQPEAKSTAEDVDVWADPQAAMQTMQQKFAEQLAEQRVQTALDIAAMKYGDEYAEAEKFVIEQQNPALARSIMQSPNPGEATVQYYRQNKILSETGGDINAFRERVIEDALKDPAIVERLLAQGREQATTQSQQNGSKPHIAPSVNQGSRAAPATPGVRRELTPQERFEKYAGTG